MYFAVIVAALVALAAGKRPCRVEDMDGNEIKNGHCRHGDACNIGPITKTWMGREVNIYMCNPPAEKRQMMLEHACRIISDGVEIISDDNVCDNDNECNIGPFEAEQDGEVVQFYKCSGHCHHHKRHGVCRVETSSGEVVKQRECRCGADMCTEGPFEKNWRGTTYNIYKCACESSEEGSDSDSSEEEGRHHRHHRRHHGGFRRHHGNHGDRESRWQRYRERGARGEGRGWYRGQHREETMVEGQISVEQD